MINFDNTKPRDLIRLYRSEIASIITTPFRVELKRPFRTELKVGRYEIYKTALLREING
jgi:hypothetical protein